MEEGPNVIYEQIRHLVRREVAILVERGSVNDVPVILMREPADATEITGERCQTQRHCGLSTWLRCRVGVFVVKTGRRRGGAGQPVEHDVGQHKVVVQVSAEELGVPGEQADRRVLEREGQRLRLLGHEPIERKLVL